MVTGMRGLCNGLGPAMFGLIFYIFHVDLNEDNDVKTTPPTDARFEPYSQVCNIQDYLYHKIIYKCM